MLLNEIKNKVCVIFRDITECRSNFVNCNKEIEKMNKDVELRFGKMILKLKLIDLFEKSGNSYTSLILSNNYKLYKKYDIMFGIKFFTLFSYMIFDYDNKKIEFYSNDISMSMIISEEKTFIKLIFIIINILCLLMILISLFFSKVTKEVE